MSNELELARRLIACKAWRWVDGMLVMSDPQSVPRPVQMTAPASSELRARVTSTVIGRWFGVFEYCVDHPDAEHETASGDDLPGTLPDLDDPATLGCLLALVREAWDDPGLSAVATWSPSTVHASDYLWSIRGGHTHGGTFRRLLTDRAWSTEAAALVAALEAAPC